MADDKKLQAAQTATEAAKNSPEPNGNDKLGAADAIMREANRLASLTKVADHLRATGSLEAAATAAEMRRSSAMDHLAEITGRINDAMTMLAARTKDAEAVMGTARDEADRMVAEATQRVETLTAQGGQIATAAKEAATNIINSAKAEAAAYADQIKADSASTLAELAAKTAQRDAMDGEIAKRQKVLDKINSQLASIAGGLNNAASNNPPASA